MKIDYLAHHRHLVPEIAELKLRHYHHLLPEKTLMDFQIGLENDLNTDNLPIGFMVVENGSFIGAFSLRVHDLKTHQHLTPWLGGVFVHPEKRIAGWGHFLFNKRNQ